MKDFVRQRNRLVAGDGNRTRDQQLGEAVTLPLKRLLVNRENLMKFNIAGVALQSAGVLTWATGSVTSGNN